jgi:Tol biopolymer transport system component
VFFLRTLGIALLVTALAAPAGMRAADSVSPQLQQAIDLQTKGDLAGAAALFEKLSRDPDRSVAARALLHLGECREGQAQAGARQAYQRVVREFADRPEAASEARQRMAGTPATALEIRQVWTGAPDTLGNISSDGRFLTYVDLESGALAVRDLRTGQSRRLTEKGSSPRISPDGKQVVYSWAGSELRVIATDPASKAGPRTIWKNADAHSITGRGWSPDGKSIAVLLSRRDDSNELAWVKVADGGVRPLKSLQQRRPRNLDISPDLRFLVYDLPVSDTAADRDIFIMTADGTREFPLVRDPADDYAPLWTPDGQGVLFVSNRTGTPGLWSVPVLEGQAGGNPVLVKPDLGPALPLGMTTSGVLYYAERQGRDDIYTAVLDPTTGKVRGAPTRLIEKFIGRNSAPAWSPDGRLLAYYSNRDSSPDIVVRTAATGSERVFNGSLLDLRQGLRWMPDSKSLLVIAKDPPAGAVFSLLDTATGSLRPIARSTLALPSLAVPPDGRSFLVAGAGVIQAYDVATGEGREVYKSPLGWILRNLSISRDGSTLAFSEGTVIYTLPAAGGEPREVARMAEAITREGLAWTPDGRYLLFARSTSPTQVELMRVPAAGGTPESTGLSGRGLSLLSMHPDGSRLAYTLGQYFQVDVWALENFLTAAGAAR